MKTRVLLVGAGHIARTHLEVLRRMPDVEVAGLCDLDLARAEALARAFGVRVCAATLDEALARSTADAAHVLVPPQAHVAVARQCLERNLHVLVEKPLALTSGDARALADLAQERGLKLAVNHNLTFHPLFLRLLRDLGRGRIGGVQQVVSVTNLPLRQLAAGDFSHFMFRTPDRIILEQGVHPLSMVHRLLGPARHAATLVGNRVELTPEQPFFKSWQIALQCARGNAQVLLGPGGDFPHSTLEVLGSDGAIRLDLLHGLYTVRGQSHWADFWDSFAAGIGDAWRARAGAWRGLTGFVLATLKLRAPADPFWRGMAGSIGAFHRAVRGGAELHNDARTAAEVLATCEQIMAAAPTPPRPSGLVAGATPPPARSDEIVVLGATGFIGGHLVERLLHEGRHVTVLVRRPDALPGFLRDPRVRVFAGSLADAGSIQRAVAGSSCVVHLATGGGDTLADLRAVMVGGAVHVAEACLAHRVRRLLFASSSAALYLGDARARITDHTPRDPRPDKRGIYARAKIECEAALEQLQRERGLPLVILRPAVVVGARGRFQHSGIGLWTRDNQCVGWGSGTTPLPLVLVTDVVDAIVRAIAAPGVDGHTFNLAGDVRLPARVFVAALARELGRPIRFHPRPAWVGFGLELGKWLVKLVSGRKPGFPSWRDLKTRGLAAQLDCSDAKQLLGWQPVTDPGTFVERAVAVHRVRPEPGA